MPTLHSLNRCLLTLGLLMVGIFANAIEPEINFKRITINDGLSLSSVYCIYQDSKGFMWFATEDGLNKYDGKNFTIYTHIPGEKNTLSYKWTELIIEDAEGFIWLGSRNGLSRLNPATDKIDNYLFNNNDQYKLSNDTITCLEKNENYLWAGTMKGLNRISLKTGKSTAITSPSYPMGLRIYDLELDENGRLWIAADKGLFVLLPDLDQMDHIVNNIPGSQSAAIFSLKIRTDSLWIGSKNAIAEYSIEKDQPGLISNTLFHVDVPGPVENIFWDNKNNLWISCRHSFHKLNGSKIETILKTPHDSPSLAIDPRKPILESKDGSIWIGTFGNGTYRINTDNTKIDHYVHDPAINTSLSDNTINSIYEDRAGGIWFGTFGAGISIYDPNTNLITTMRHNPYGINSMSSSFVWSILEDDQQNIWIGTNASGIDIYCPEKDSFQHIVHNPSDPESLPEGAVREIFQSRNKTIWVGTDGGGLSKYNPEKKSFRHFKNIPGDPSTISSNIVRTIFEDSTGIMWIGTRNGLNKFNPRTEKFKRYLNDPDNENSISHNFVYSAIYMDSRGDLWVGTYGGGLNKMDVESERFISYQFDPADPSSISDNIVFTIYEDEKGYFWIGTNSGLNLFNPSTGKFKRYGTEAGLPNDVIYGIMPDKNMLWITTNKGVSRLDLTEFHFKNFDARDGLQSNEFNGGAFYAGESGKIYVGGVYGLSIIEPEKIKPVENSAELIISRLEILGKDVQVLREGMLPDSSYSKGSLIEMAQNYYVSKHLAYMDEIRLDYHERFFSIEFSALNHHLPEKLNFRYRMKGLYDYWSNAGNRNYVTYANMKPGTYVFQVDASNTDGKLTGNPAELKLVITPPFWRSYWFILILVWITILIIVFIYRFLLNQKTNLLLKEQNAQITYANNQLQESENNLKALNATKDKFFSIISHDLKNPFASVLSISELLDKNFEITEADELKYGIKKIHKTNKHIYELLENLLTWSKTQRGNIKVEKVNFNISKVIETNLNILRLAADKKKIQIVNNAPEELFAYADREMISTVFRNLLNNAIKFTPEGKEIKIETRRSKHEITAEINDQGIGIAAEHVDRLFNIEEKFKTEGTSGEKGTGLGLIICKEFVEKNSGKIEVSSQPGQGSTFSFTIPSAED